jgi:4-amino-4-deoxy-L-arabinose transferase-like glycosyltransferase
MVNKVKIELTKFEWILLSVIVIVFFAELMLINLNTGLWWDEASFLVQAKSIIGEKVCISETNRSWEAHRLPGFPLIIAPFIKIFDLNLSLLRIVEIFFVIITILSLYLLATNLYNKKVAITSIILLASSWLVLFYTLRILAHVPAMAIATLALYLFYTGWEEKNNKKILISALLFGFYYSIRIEALYFMAALSLYLVLKEKFSLFKNKKFYLFIIAFIIPFSLYQIWQFHSFGSLFYQEKLNYELVKNYGESYFAYFSMLPHIIAGSIFEIPIVLIFFIIGLIYLVINYKKKSNLMLLLFFLVFFIASSISPHHEDRYFIPVLPIIFIIASIAINIVVNLISKNENYRLIGCIILAIFFSYLSLSYGLPIITSKAPTYSVVIEAGKQLNYITNKYVFVPFSVSAPNPQICLFGKDKIYLRSVDSNALDSATYHPENLTTLLEKAREKDALIYYAFPYDGDIDYLTIRRFITNEGFLDSFAYSNWLNETGLEIVSSLRENKTGAIVILYKVKK